MNAEEIKSKLVEVMAEEYEIDPATVGEDSPLMETFGLDSLDMVDVVVLIEKHFGIILKQEDFAGMRTVGDFVNIIVAKCLDAK